MYAKKSTISSSQNLKSKLTLKDQLFTSTQIHSQPQSSKGGDHKKQENLMKKRLHNLLGKQIVAAKPFKASPTGSQKHHYFVSASVQQISKNIIQKQNHTENYDSTKSIKGNTFKFIKPQKQKEFNKYQDFLENNNFEIQKQFGTFVKQVDSIQPEQLPHQQIITERSSLIAMFEKLNAKESQNFNQRRQTLQDSDQNLFSLKQSIEEDYLYPKKSNYHKKIPLSNNSSGQLCSYQHPNSSSTQLQQYPTSLVSIDQKSPLDDNLGLILERTTKLLTQYTEKLKQTEIEKQMLVQEVQYWKSKYMKGSKRQ